MRFIALVAVGILVGCQHRTNSVAPQQDAVSVQDAWVKIGREVRNPGKYPWREGMRLKDAISMAGGLTEFATSGEIMIYHATGAVEQHRVEEVIKQDGPNPVLKPGDIIRFLTPYQKALTRAPEVQKDKTGYVLTLLAVGYSDSPRSSHQASTLSQLTNSGATIMAEGGMVHPGDPLILVLDIPRREKSPQKIVVDKNGYIITLPYNVKVQAQGKTLRQLEHEIYEKYVPRIFRKVTVTLTRDE